MAQLENTDPDIAIVNGQPSPGNPNLVTQMVFRLNQMPPKRWRDLLNLHWSAPEYSSPGSTLRILEDEHGVLLVWNAASVGENQNEVIEQVQRAVNSTNHRIRTQG